MGCCGCSLAASTITAVVLGLVESIVGIIWNIFVIVVVESHKGAQSNKSVDITLAGNTTTTLSPLAAEEVTEIATSSISPFSNKESSWEQLKLTLISDEAVDHAHVFELSVTALVLNTFWLITTLALAVGNSEKCRDMLKPWIITTIIITITDIAATIYFIFKAVKTYDEDLDVVINDRFFVENIYVLLATLFSRGGIVIWVANVALCIFVAQRIKEIEVQKKKRMPFDTDLRIGPYTLHSPYEAFETDSYDKGGLRPHTPPPDYEANLGGGYRKPHGRRPSFPSDCETLPVSLRSNSTGGHPRPVSSIRGSYPYPYDDDTVELQHRASIAAENHYQSFAYENRGLETVDSIKDGRINIPRPTLKISR